MISLFKYKRERELIADYQELFLDGNEFSLPGKRILTDLGVFCRVNGTNLGETPTEVARMAGRREVFNWITKSIHSNKTTRLNEAIHTLEEEMEDEEMA